MASPGRELVRADYAISVGRIDGRARRLEETPREKCHADEKNDEIDDASRPSAKNIGTMALPASKSRSHRPDRKSAANEDLYRQVPHGKEPSFSRGVSFAQAT